MAPPSRKKSPLESFITEAVSPAALLPFPEVYTPMGATFSMNFKN